MTDQEKQDFKNKYQKDPVKFIEDYYPDVKLHTYQKIFLNAMFLKEKTFSFFNARMNQKRWLENMSLEIMKTLEMDFQIWSLKGIDVYEKGVKVKTIRKDK